MTAVEAGIHPLAQIDANARLGEGITVHPFVVIERDVEVGDGTVLLPGTVLQNGARIGKNCRLGPYAVIGGEPMDSKFRGERSYARLADNVEAREFVTVHRSTGEETQTCVGEGSLLMSYVHISHNVQVGRHTVITTAVQLGGHCQVGDHAFLGSTAILHQFCRVGDYAMFGAGSAGNQDVLPFHMARGNPARHFRLNRVGLQRHGIDGERYRSLERASRAVRRRDRGLLEELAQDNEDARLLLDFLATSERGVSRFQGGH